MAITTPPRAAFEGMEVDLCYPIAAAVFGVSYARPAPRSLSSLPT